MNFLADESCAGPVRVGVSLQRLLEVSLLAGIGKILDEFCGRGKECLEAVLNGTVSRHALYIIRDCWRKMRVVLARRFGGSVIRPLTSLRLRMSTSFSGYE